MKALPTLALALALLFAMPAFAQAREIGSATFRNGDRNVVIRAENGGDLKAVKLCVRGDALLVDRFAVEFGDGSREDFNVRNVIRQGDCTQWKNFSTGRRNVKKILLVAQSAGGRNPSQVTVLGSSEREDNDEFGNEGGRRIGVLELNNRNDRDRASMNGNDISQVKICVSQNDARIEEFEVQFGNGQRQEIQLRQIFRRGTCSMWKNLDGGNRNVKEAFIRGSAFGRDAKIIVLGRR